MRLRRDYVELGRLCGGWGKSMGGGERLCVGLGRVQVEVSEAIWDFVEVM